MFCYEMDPLLLLEIKLNGMYTLQIFLVFMFFATLCIFYSCMFKTLIKNLRLNVLLSKVVNLLQELFYLDIYIFDITKMLSRKAFTSA